MDLRSDLNFVTKRKSGKGRDGRKTYCHSINVFKIYQHENLVVKPTLSIICITYHTR